ncbi:hypothetical protein Lal_00030190 [Lupinus albus]|nr:hypothetical protein Lal_00030190 [Lupinus albus]
MVRSMINHSSLPDVLRKAVNKTPYELWTCKISSTCTFEVVQLRRGLIGHMKENWTQEQLAVTFSRGYKFYDPTTRLFFETRNVRFLEEVDFGRKRT